MDNNLREIAVGDLSEPKHMRRIGEAFYGRVLAYRSALATHGEKALVEALTRNIYGGASVSPATPARLATYILQALRDVRAQQPPILLPVSCVCRTQKLLFLLKTKVAEIYGQKSDPMERSCGRGRYSGNWSACRD
ncbi:MAG TPA: ubiquinol-cytochrome C chaperone family protein [Pseudolabrys sp.]|nr:ubiquinol-cytochrome C chaperone family protein [Pseudolabrys sp.]